MEKHISQKDLQRLYSQQAKSIGTEEIKKIIEEKRIPKWQIAGDNTIFLCHSHKDKTIVDRVTLLFSQVNYNLYVDWMDKELPAEPNKQTASMLKDKIKHCKRFLFLATARALESKWCDWELGIAYSLKKDTEIAILPIESKSGKWKGSEYLELFPEMEFKSSNLEQLDISQISIKYSDTKSIPLKRWLSHDN